MKDAFDPDQLISGFKYLLPFTPPEIMIRIVHFSGRVGLTNTN